MPVKNFLIRGRPGSGKSTAISIIELALRERGYEPCGIRTPEVRRGGRRIGFLVVDLSTGRSEVMASVGVGGPRVGRYSVRLREFESVAIEALDACSSRDVALIDEVGKMELLSPRFTYSVSRLIDSRIPVVATAPSYDLPFLEELVSRPDVAVFVVRRGDSERVARSVLLKLLDLLKTSSRR